MYTGATLGVILTAGTVSERCRFIDFGGCSLCLSSLFYPFVQPILGTRVGFNISLKLFQMK